MSSLLEGARMLMLREEVNLRLYIMMRGGRLRMDLESGCTPFQQDWCWAVLQQEHLRAFDNAGCSTMDLEMIDSDGPVQKATALDGTFKDNGLPSKARSTILTATWHDLLCVYYT